MIVKEIVADFYGCREDLLNDSEGLLRLCEEGASAVGAVVVNKLMHSYEPQGVSVILLLAESHIYVATWPEFGLANINIFLCNDKMDPYRVLDILRRKLEPGKVSENVVSHFIGPSPE